MIDLNTHNEIPGEFTFRGLIINLNATFDAAYPPPAGLIIAVTGTLLSRAQTQNYRLPSSDISLIPPRTTRQLQASPPGAKARGTRSKKLPIWRCEALHSQDQHANSRESRQAAIAPTKSKQGTWPRRRQLCKCGHVKSIHRKVARKIKLECNFQGCNCHDYRPVASSGVSKRR